VLVAWLLALAIIGISVVPMGLAVVRDGTLVDNDDAMRLVQMREWMDGKGWYDLKETRVDPPRGMLSHWPRLIELPMAGAIRALGLVVDPDLAERVVVAVWPGMLMAALVLGMLVVAAQAFSPPALLAAALIVALNPLFLFQLAPGRTDHHGVQMLLALVLTGSTVASIVDKRRRAAALAGVAGALSVAIGLGPLPVVAAAATLFGAAWIVQGEAQRRAMGTFGASFALSTLILFAATVTPARWGVTACDALSPPWLWLACGGGLALLALAAIEPPSKGSRRAACALAVGGAVVAAFALLWPHCLRGPLADTDPLVRALWLSGVGEATPTHRLALQNPARFLYFLVFPLIGALALGIAALRQGQHRARFLVLFIFALSALVIAVPAMRGVPLAAIFALFGWLYLFDSALHASKPDGATLHGGPVRVALALAVVVAALPFAWDALGTAAEASSSPSTPPAYCGVRADMAPLADEPRGLVLAPLRLGPRILVATGHDVIGVPYHRNNEGNVAALRMLLAAPSDAGRLIEDRGVDYVAVCLGDPDLARLTAYRSGSLLRSLIENQVPTWLEPLPARGPIRAWRLVDQRVGR
jgi:hypothetical protein